MEKSNSYQEGERALIFDTDWRRPNIQKESEILKSSTAGDSALPPKGSVEVEANQNTTSSREVETTEQTDSSTEDTPPADLEYKTTRSGRCVKPPTRYRDYTNSS